MYKKDEYTVAAEKRSSRAIRRVKKVSAWREIL